jgi:heme-degrading monooxygenase HmoA
MYARIVSGMARPDKREEAISIYRDSVLPSAKKQKGFKGAFLLSDSTTNKSYSITFWDTEDDMESGETSMYLAKQLARVAASFAGPPTTERLEVLVHAEID